MLSACGFESLQAHHVGASCISLAPTFFKSRSALIPLLLLSNRDPLRWVRGWVGAGREVNASKVFTLSSSEIPCLARIPALRRGFLAGQGISSLPNRIRCAGFRFGLSADWDSVHRKCSLFLLAEGSRFSWKPVALHRIFSALTRAGAGAVSRAPAVFLKEKRIHSAVSWGKGPPLRAGPPRWAGNSGSAFSTRASHGSHPGPSSPPKRGCPCGAAPRPNGGCRPAAGPPRRPGLYP